MQILRVYNPDATKMADGTSYSKKNRWNNNVNNNDYGTGFFSKYNVGFICEWDSVVEKNDDIGILAKHILKDGNYKIACYKDERYYLDIAGSDIPAEAGSNVQLWFTEDGHTQKADIWTIEYDDVNSVYRISQIGQDISLGVKDGSKEKRGDVRVWNNDDTSAQQWEIQINDDGSYRIKAKCSGLSLDVAGGVLERKTNIQQWDNHDDDPEKWRFIPYNKNMYYVVNVEESVNLRGKPSTDSTVYGKVPKGCSVTYTGESNDGYMLVRYNGMTGYVSSQYLTQLEN